MTVKKIIFLTSILTLFLQVTAFSQNNGILLQWKIAKGDTLKYQTVMKVAQSLSIDTTKTDTTANVFKNLSKWANKVNENMKYQTNLFLNRKNNRLIDIEMKTINVLPDSIKKNTLTQAYGGKNEKDKRKNKKAKVSDEELDSLDLQDMFKGFSGFRNMIVLRGRITQDGEVVSNYYKNGQKNLVSTLFALPNKVVQIGEKWKIGANFIEMDQNFYADSISSINEVYIEKVIEKDNDKIAVIKYNIQEYVIGDFNTMVLIPGMHGDEKTYMKYSHIATGYFSIGRGRWISYEGEAEVDSNFAMIGGKSKTIFKLIE